MPEIITEQYLLKKEIDWSTLTQGFTLPVTTSVLFTGFEDRFLNRGEGKEITVLLNGKAYTAKVTNEKFDSKFDAGHQTDIVRILYRKNLSKALCDAFPGSFTLLDTIRKTPGFAKKKHAVLPEGSKEYLIIYATDRPDTYIFEPLLANELAEVDEAFSAQTEREAEQELARLDQTDSGAAVIEKPGIRKIRKLDRKIGDSLKLHYGYRCQICGAFIGEPYGAHVIEAHHIDYFVKSKNNDAGNILIVCPNHHSVIHDRNPLFDIKTQTYTYPNGYREGLLLNDHIH